MTDRTFTVAYVPLKKGLDSPFSQGRTYRDQIYRHMSEADWNGEWLESTDLPIRVLWAGSSIWLPGDFWERRGSNHLGIELVTRGQLLFQAQGKEWTAEKGDVCILAKNSNYLYTTGKCDALHKRFIIVDGSVIDSINASGLLGTCPVIRPRDIYLIAERFKQINTLLRDKPQSFQNSASVIVYQVLLELQSSIRHAWPIPVERAVRFMINNIQEPMTNAAMASAAGVSISHLSLLFRETIGCAPMQYCTDRKMAAARHLLSQSEKSVKEIAQMVGYKDQLYFSKCFHHHSGISPREFRQGARRYQPDQN